MNFDGYAFCVRCGDPTIYSYLPQDVQSLISGYVGNYGYSHLKCPQCEFTIKNDIAGSIERLYPEKFDYHEEEDQEEFVKQMVNDKIITIYPANEWERLKWNYKSLGILGPNKSSLLVDLTFLSWMDCKRIGLVDNSDKKVLFEISYDHDIWIQIILLLEKLSIINWVIALNPYEDNWEEQINSFSDVILDDFVIADDTDSDGGLLMDTEDYCNDSDGYF